MQSTAPNGTNFDGSKVWYAKQVNIDKEWTSNSLTINLCLTFCTKSIFDIQSHEWPYGRAYHYLACPPLFWYLWICKYSFTIASTNVWKSRQCPHSVNVIWLAQACGHHRWAGYQFWPTTRTMTPSTHATIYRCSRLSLLQNTQSLRTVLV